MNTYSIDFSNKLNVFSVLEYFILLSWLAIGACFGSAVGINAFIGKD